MPMDRSRYPADWDRIAWEAKQRAGFECEECGMPHSADDFTRVLTVHPLDHDPMNNDPSNLVALCAPCHLAQERKWKRSAKGKQGTLL